MTLEPRTRGLVLVGGQDARVTAPGASIVSQRSAAEQDTGGAAADPWPRWARDQLLQAVDIAERTPDTVSVAGVLYRDWYNPIVCNTDRMRTWRPLAGVYRGAHAGSAHRVTHDGVQVVDRHDVVGTDGWWRTWGQSWTPPRSRPGSVRVLFTPQPDQIASFVRAVTSAFADARTSWSLGATTSARRLRRPAAAVLDLPNLEAFPTRLLDVLAPMLRAEVPALCLPIAPGIAVAGYPDNGMTFGEHRCHLVALALRHPSSARHPLRAIAAVFAAHGLDPAAPHRAG